MGGGAGIDIEVEIEQFYVARSRNNKRNFRIVSQPVVTKWHAVGYDDGLRNLRGDILKTTVRIADISADAARYMEDNLIRTSDRLAAWVEEKQYPRKMIWQGWCRGSWRDVFPLEIPFDVTVEGMGDTTAVLTIAPADRVYFKYFWDDLFSVSERCEMTLDDLHTNYCVPASERYK